MTKHGAEAVRRYRAFGCVLESERELPLAEVEGTPQWVLQTHSSEGDAGRRQEVLHDVLDEPGGRRLSITRDGATVTFEYPPWTFWLRAGDGENGPAELCYAEEETAESPEHRGIELAALLERVVLPVDALLHRARTVVLHGNAVVVDGRAWVFLGESGAGKSTTALELLRRGALLLADDRVPIDAEAATASPGPSSLRLRDDATLEFPAREPTRKGSDGKQRVSVAHASLAGGTYPLAGLVFLTPLRGGGSAHDAESVALEPLETRDLLVELLRQSFDLTHTPPPLRVELFRRLGALARRARGYRCVLVHGSLETRAKQMDRLTDLLSSFAESGP